MPGNQHLLRSRFVAAVLAAVPLGAAAHDTWFQPVPAPPTASASKDLLLALGTGTLYPRYDSGIDAKYLVNQGCQLAGTGDAARTAPLQPVRNDDTSLVLRVPPGAARCWAQLAPFEIEIPPATVEVYFKDINAGPELRATWAAMERRGLPWRERYSKHARIELQGTSATTTPMDMDMLIEGDGSPVRVGQALVFRVLRDGAPLAGLPVELRSEATRFGIWRRTDGEGRVRITVPLPGRWLLRGTDLRVSTGDPDRWDSRFVTLAFQVQDAATGTPRPERP